MQEWEKGSNLDTHLLANDFESLEHRLARTERRDAMRLECLLVHHHNILPRHALKAQHALVKPERVQPPSHVVQHSTAGSNLLHPSSLHRSLRHHHIYYWHRRLSSRANGLRNARGRCVDQCRFAPYRTRRGPYQAQASRIHLQQRLSAPRVVGLRARCASCSGWPCPTYSCCRIRRYSSCHYWSCYCRHARDRWRTGRSSRNYRGTGRCSRCHTSRSIWPQRGQPSGRDRCFCWPSTISGTRAGAGYLPYSHSCRRGWGSVSRPLEAAPLSGKRERKTEAAARPEKSVLCGRGPGLGRYLLHGGVVPFCDLAESLLTSAQVPRSPAARADAEMR